MNYLDAVVFLLQDDQRTQGLSSLRLRSSKQRNQSASRSRRDVQGVGTIGPGTTTIVPAAADTSGGPLSTLSHELIKHQQDGGTSRLKQTVRANLAQQLGPSSRGNLTRVVPLSDPVTTGRIFESVPPIPAAESIAPATPTPATAATHGFNAWLSECLASQPTQLRLSDSDKRMLLAMDDTTRLVFVQKVLQALYMSEILLLVEFVEVVVPCVYSTCSTGSSSARRSHGCRYLCANCCPVMGDLGAYFVSAFNSSNRDYYPHFEGKTADDIIHATVQVMVYVVVEAVSLVLLGVMVRHKLRISALHQLAFVLETQWQEVQSKLVLWAVFNFQTLVQHYGVDFSFQFAWLRTSARPT